MPDLKKQRDKDGISLLGDIYKNVKMASDSVISLIKHTDVGDFRTELTAELEEYERLARRSAKMLEDAGERPREENAITRTEAKIGIAMNVASDPGVSHMAQMTIEGTTMGITDLLRKTSEFKKGGGTKEIADFAEEVAAFEESAVEKMKSFL